MDVRLLVDYLTMSFKEAPFMMDFLIDYLNLPKDELEPCHSKYGDGFYYKSVKLFCRNGLVILDMSGQGCRTIEALNPGFDWYAFFKMFKYELTFVERSDLRLVSTGYHTYKYVVSDHRIKTSELECHIARLDVSMDVLNSDVNFKKILRYTKQNKVISKANRAHYGYDFAVGSYYTSLGDSLYFGSPKSDRRLRIYDKGLEQGITDVSWIRFEMQLRNDNATSYILNLFQMQGDFAKTYYGVLHDFIRFVTQPVDRINKHQSRSTTCKWWLDILHHCAKLRQLYLPGNEYSIFSIADNFHVRQASSVKALVDAFGSDYVMQQVENAKLNKAQKQAVDEYIHDELDRTVSYINSEEYQEWNTLSIQEEMLLSLKNNNPRLYQKYIKLKGRTS